MNKKGPTYGVELLDSIIVDNLAINGVVMPDIRMVLPTRDELLCVIKECSNGHCVVKAYELLLNHRREQDKEIERLRIAEVCWCDFKKMAGEIGIPTKTPTGNIGWVKAEIAQLRAKLALLEHQADCHFYTIACRCNKCDRLQAAIDEGGAT